MIPQEKGHTEYLDLLTSQFKDKDTINKFLSVFLSEMQNTESGFFQLLNERGIGLAYGDRLDQIGGVIGESRKGRTDGEYKRAILDKVIVNNGEATPNDAMSAIKVNTQGTHIQIWEHYPACVVFSTDGNVTQDTPNIVKNLVPAGVDGGYICANVYNEAHIPQEYPETDEGQWLPEYNEDPSIVVPASQVEVRLAQGLFNEGVLINTDDGEGYLVVSDEQSSYVIFQGVFPDLFSPRG